MKILKANLLRKLYNYCNQQNFYFSSVKLCHVPNYIDIIILKLSRVKGKPRLKPQRYTDAWYFRFQSLFYVLYVTFKSHLASSKCFIVHVHEGDAIMLEVM